MVVHFFPAFLVVPVRATGGAVHCSTNGYIRRIPTVPGISGERSAEELRAGLKVSSPGTRIENILYCQGHSLCYKLYLPNHVPKKEHFGL